MFLHPHILWLLVLPLLLFVWQIRKASAQARTKRWSTAILRLLDHTLASGTIEKMEPGKLLAFPFEIPLAPDKQGVFAFVGEVIFHDENDHPFTALSAGTFKLKSLRPPQMSGRASTITLKRNGDLTFHLSTRMDSPQSVSAAIHLPRSLTTPEPRTTLVVNPGEESHITFPIENHTGSGGAKYPIFCVFEYDEENGQHQTFLVRTAIRIQEPQNWFIKTNLK